MEGFEVSWVVVSVDLDHVSKITSEQTPSKDSSFDFSISLTSLTNASPVCGPSKFLTLE